MYEIATILPPSEHFTHAAAGAIALFVHETSITSAYQEHITVYGNDEGKQRQLSGVKYKGVTPSMRLLFGRNGGYARALVELLRQRPVGLIEVHNRVQIFYKLAKAFPNVPISFYFHNDPQTIKGTETPKERWALLERADAIYCCSDFVRRRFMTGLDAARSDHVYVLPHGLAPIESKPEKDKLILFAGRLIPEKGVLELAQAAQRLLPHFPEWQIAFVGANRPGGKNTTSYARAVGKAVDALGKQAVFLGYQPHSKVVELYGRAAIAVVPSTWAEPLGRTAIEALMARCALVTSGHGGLSEIAGQAGIIVSPVTPNGLALALQGLIEDPLTLYHIQENCAQRAPLYSLESVRQRFDAARYRLLAQAYGG
jgi:glycosyltransferase involved in cell wall biosynthesis